jgi:hypothetical protein
MDIKQVMRVRLNGLRGREVTVLSHATTVEGHTVPITQHGFLERLPIEEEHTYRVTGLPGALGEGVEFSADNVASCDPALWACSTIPVIILF